ncbi:MAG: hypothetical protein IT372_03650 [Polyangiaceae bacterium]|nr:hypothetical protein [Polyangiaceae bacterium]
MTTAATGEEAPDEGDEGMTTMMIGEEQIPDEEGEEGFTTVAGGEEEGAPGRPAKPAPTKKAGEEATSTLAAGEESEGKGGGRKGGPFGRF